MDLFVNEWRIVFYYGCERLPLFIPEAIANAISTNGQLRK
jgi:hypothetical protein